LKESRELIENAVRDLKRQIRELEENNEKAKEDIKKLKEGECSKS
jgi:archaellum component FlaC